MSGEREVWRVMYDTHAGHFIHVEGKGAVVDGKEEYIQQIVREHNAYQDAVAALEYVREIVVSNFNGDDLSILRRFVPAALQSIKEQKGERDD